MELSVVFPVLNEEHKIAADIDAAFAFMDDNRIEGEVIIVDDGSTDNTGGLVYEIRTRLNRPLHLISYSPNQGKGYAVKQGVMAARGGVIMFADSGNCIPLDNILPAYETIRQGQTDIAHASRMIRESRVPEPRKLHRRMVSLLFRKFVKVYAGLPGYLTDTQCGLKLYRGAIAKELYDECRTAGFLFDVEIILRALDKGYIIKEFPVEWRPDPDTRLRLFPLLLRTIPDLNRIKRDLSR